ncbi:MAG: hypothetical protein ACRD5L_08185 [Bryobacteraceae bacterium]
MHRMTVKTSTIFIAKGERTRVYRSVKEIPERLRQELEQSTNGFNSATILIADRRGRAEILRALKGMPSGLRTRLSPSLTPNQAAAPPTPRKAVRPLARFLRHNWPEILLPGAVGLLLWVALNWR